MSRISRNAPGPCGSGKKYKRCCIGQSRPAKADRGPRLRAGRHPTYPCLTSDIPGADAGPRHISFYEVVKSKLGRALALRDLVHDDEPVRWVEARELSRGRFRKRGRIIGARLMPGTPWKASGAFYSTQEPHTSYLLGRIRDGLAENTDPAKVRRIHSQFIVLGWLHGMARASESYFADAKPGSLPS